MLTGCRPYSHFEIFNADIWYMHQIIGSIRPKSLIEVTKMVFEGKNHASTATTNLLSFTQWSIDQNKYSDIQNNNSVDMPKAMLADVSS